MNGVAFELLKSVEQFLYREARCMDEHRYDDWLALWEQELLYWVPCDDADDDPRRAVSIIHDRRAQLEQRVTRLKGRYAFAQQPRTRLLRVVSNVEIESDSGESLVVGSTFALGDWRSDRQTAWFGRNRHVLVRHGDGFRMREKKVLLLNNSGALGNLTFLV